MLLAELSERSGVSVASIKYYRREGLLPPGDQLTATRQDYGRRHLDRLDLIGAVREVAGGSIADLKNLTAILDDPGRPLVEALEVAQAIAAGLPARRHDRPVPPQETPLVGQIIADRDWPDVASGPRAALDSLLRELTGWGMDLDPSTVALYARAAQDLAVHDLAQLQRDSAGDPPSPDVACLRVVVGIIAHNRLVVTLRALALASLSVRAAQAVR